MMQAGPALDGIIHEKIMGLELLTHSATTLLGEPMHINMPPYSTDLTAAFSVVEKLGNWHGFDFHIMMYADPCTQQKYEAGWYEPSHDGPESRAVGHADTIPHAICLAALETL